jgi:uncharacterized protein (TIGR03085 family)
VSKRTVLLAERAALCDTLERYGPTAPTLCEGWLTLDLAAHLVVRERDPRSGPGILFGDTFFGRYTRTLMDRAKAKGYPALVVRLRAGPPFIMQRAMAGVNVNENWIHHEDVRRANGEAPRPPDPDVDEILWRMLQRTGKFATRRARGTGVELVLPDGRKAVLRKGSSSVTLTGAVGELVLYLSGRRSAAQVELSGDPAAIELIQTMKLGV